jgi:hypothetical protein
VVWFRVSSVHTQISAIALSKSGRYLATGQVTYMGFTADIIIWDLESRQLLHRLGLHKARLSFLTSNTMPEHPTSHGLPCHVAH